MESSAITHNEFVQIRPWNDCINNCSFCSVAKRCKNTPLESKKLRLNRAAELVKTLKSKQIGIMGGEFFEGQLKGCEEEWEELLKTLLQTEAKVFITANLIHEQHFLHETIDLLKERLLVCTSYDEVGRFHTQEVKNNWFQNIDKLHEKGVNLICTCIQTQDFLESKNELPEWLDVNLCDPHLGVEWYIAVDKANYHDHLIAENKLFNLPRRSTAIKWMRSHPDVTARYAAYNATHSDTIYGFNENDCLTTELEERLTDDNCVNPECGHPFFCQCYADSNKCMMCDATQIMAAIS